MQELSDVNFHGHTAEFFNFMRMDVDLFNEILHDIEPIIFRRDTNMRKCISAGERLAVTLRYLASGDLYPSLQAQFRIHRFTITKIIPQVCKAIVQAYEAELMNPPSTPEGWSEISDRFASRWNLHHVLGAIDGKHIRIRRPPEPGIAYKNYKKYHSIILLAVVDADYRFVYIEVGAPGSAGDPGLFKESPLKQAMEENLLHMPPPDCLPNDNVVLPYFLIGDEAFGLRTWFMKPYPSARLTHDERIYNYRLSRARRSVECTFGIRAAR